MRLFHINLGQTLRNFLIKYFNHPHDKYLHQTISEFEKKAVQFFAEILINGIILFFSLYWLWFTYRIIRLGIYFGWIEIPLYIISLGFFSYVVRSSYRFFKKDWMEAKK